MGRELPILFNTDMVCAVFDELKTATRRTVKQSVWENFVCEGGKAIYYLDKKTDSMKSPLYKAPYQVGDILYVRETWAFQSCIECTKQMEDKSCMLGKMPTIHEDKDAESEGCYIYRAGHLHPERIVWRPSIHMPKAAARIWLKVTDVRVERLKDITEEQAVKEGIRRLYDDMSDMEYLDWTKRTGIYPKAKKEWGYKNYLWHGNFGMHGTGNKMSDAWRYQYSSYDNAKDSFSSLWNTTVPLKDWNVHGWDANPWVWAINFERCKKPAAGLQNNEPSDNT